MGSSCRCSSVYLLIHRHHGSSIDVGCTTELALYTSLSSDEQEARSRQQHLNSEVISRYTTGLSMQGVILMTVQAYLSTSVLSLQLLKCALSCAKRAASSRNSKHLMNRLHPHCRIGFAQAMESTDRGSLRTPMLATSRSPELSDEGASSLLKFPKLPLQQEKVCWFGPLLIEAPSKIFSGFEDRKLPAIDQASCQSKAAYRRATLCVPSSGGMPISYRVSSERLRTY